MYRKDSITVKEWLEHSDKPLLVTGAYVKIGLNQEKFFKKSAREYSAISNNELD